MTKPKTPLSPDPHETRAPQWTKARMAEFLRALAATHSVSAAARSVGMSRQSAYQLRARLKGEPFDLGWETAFQHSYDALHQAALERALYGVEVPVFHGGEQVGTRRHFDERLTCFLLAARNHQGAQQLGRYRAATDFYAERWDMLLHHVETGHARWNGDAAAGNALVEGDPAAAQAAALQASESFTAPDPLPRSRRE